MIYTLKNINGIELEAIAFGATITSLKIPLELDKKIDIVLGFDDLSSYINSFDSKAAPYFGAIVGRFAGRIKNGHFSINKKPIFLDQNHGTNHLHGGNQGLSKVFWEMINKKENTITFEYISPNGEDNYPGELSTQVTYCLTDENELKVEMIAKTTEDTIVNLTQHSYFNLDGHTEDVLQQELVVNSNKFLEVDPENIPTGKFLDTKNSMFDFSKPTKCPSKIDNTFVLNDNDSVSAVLISKKNNLKMSVFTNQPAVHIYVGGNCFNQIKGKENANYHATSGICFETQNFPDAPNHEHFPNAILKKDETYRHKTTFKFEKI